MNVDADRYQDETLFQTVETRDSLLVTGICTSAGRGKRLPSEHTQRLPKSPPTSGVGRAAVIKNMMTINKTNHRHEQQRDPFNSKLQSQLRQVTGEGFSNAFIEHNFPNTSLGASGIAPLTVLEKKPDREEQFEDAPVQMIPSTSGIQPLTIIEQKPDGEEQFDDAPVQMILFPSTLPDAGKSSKAKGGNGRKGRVFRKMPLAPESSEGCVYEGNSNSNGNGTGNGKKLISDIFKKAPVDYKQSYFSNKKDKFKLQSKDDFPTL